ncbi:MAG TPA: hypothetical protein VFA90_13020 [Terriglobales bacterium]|nr:hypothetical protein [Terriglobales bacterium]
MTSSPKRAPVHERLRFLNRDGKQILFVDLSNCSARIVEEVVREIPDILSTLSLGSALVLTDFTGASFDDDAVMALKETAVFNKPYVKKSALVAVAGMPKSVHDGMKNFARREWGVFQSRTEAIAWLLED